MLIKHARVFCDDGHFRSADVRFDEKITFIGQTDEDGFDASGCLLIPGLVDIHTHGAMGADFCDQNAERLDTLSRYYIQNGITSFCATTMTLDEVVLIQIMQDFGQLSVTSGARFVGVNLEGPFINPLKKGAQAQKDIRKPDIDLFNRLNKAANGSIRLVELAPEMPGALAFIKEAAKICTVSLAHSASDYDLAIQAFDAGATHVTHLFNAMDPFLHRSPGIVGAAADAGATVELICDGIHLHPSIVRASFKLFGAGHCCLISDSMRSAGMADGVFELGGQPVTVSQNKATLADGTLAGSSINLMTGVKNAIDYGVAPEKALIAATTTPARAIGLFNKIGSITIGKKADLVLLDTDWNVLQVFLEGKEMMPINGAKQFVV